MVDRACTKVATMLLSALSKARLRALNLQTMTTNTLSSGWISATE